MAGSCWLHCRLRFCRRRGRGDGGFLLASLKAEVTLVGGGGGQRVLCCLHCRLRLCRMAGSCWIHCRLRLSREGEDGFLLASL